PGDDGRNRYQQPDLRAAQSLGAIVECQIRNQAGRGCIKAEVEGLWRKEGTINSPPSLRRRVLFKSLAHGRYKILWVISTISFLALRLSESRSGKATIQRGIL